MGNWLDKDHSLPAIKTWIWGQFQALKGGTRIVADTDLNTIFDTGNYYCDSNTVARSLMHTPLAASMMYAFTMKVGYATGVGYVYQELIEYYTGARYYRYHDSNTQGDTDTTKWKDWIAFTRSDILLPLGFDRTTRRTTANIPSNNSAGLSTFLATSSMTEGKPKGDGNIIQMNWDNGQKWATQFAVLNGTGRIQARAQRLNSGVDWSDWRFAAMFGEDVSPAAGKAVVTGTNAGDVIATDLAGAVEGSPTEIKRRGAFVAQSSNGGLSKPWYKVAEVTVTAKSQDREITFLVEDTMAMSGNKYYMQGLNGILKVRCRTNENDSFGDSTITSNGESTYLTWLSNSGYFDLDFALAVKVTAGTSVVYELWTKINYNYHGRRFIVLSEGYRNTKESEDWTLYNTWTNGSQASLPSGYEYIYSNISAQSAHRLVDEDLNNIKFANDTTYSVAYFYAAGSNTVANSPLSEGASFGLMLKKSAGNICIQEIWDASGSYRYYRYWEGNTSSWSNWTRMPSSDSAYVHKSGDTMAGVLTLKGNMYEDSRSGAMNANNSDIYGLNSIYTADKSENAAEGFHFYRDATHVDSLWIQDGDLLFTPNRVLGQASTDGTKALAQKVGRFTSNPTANGQVAVTDGTTGGMVATDRIVNPVTTEEVREAGGGLDSSGTHDKYLSALLKAICVKYPNIQNVLFMGAIRPNSMMSYEVLIYNTSEVDSNGLPRYSFGIAESYHDSSVFGRSMHFGTSNYAFTCYREGFSALYGTCTTAAGTVEKVASVGEFFQLFTGTVVNVRMTNANSAANPTLNVNGTGAKPIVRYGTTAAGNNANSSWNGGGVYSFVYDGTSWVMLDFAHRGNDNTIPSAYCTTAAATAAKTASCTNYNLLANSYIHVLIAVANSYNGAITLNINGKGAKPIWINGAASSSSNKTLPAGTYLVFYDGSKYYFSTQGYIYGKTAAVGANDTTLATTAFVKKACDDATDAVVGDHLIYKVGTVVHTTANEAPSSVGTWKRTYRLDRWSHDPAYYDDDYNVGGSIEMVFSWYQVSSTNNEGVTGYFVIPGLGESGATVNDISLGIDFDGGTGEFIDVFYNGTRYRANENTGDAVGFHVRGISGDTLFFDLAGLKMTTNELGTGTVLPDRSSGTGRIKGLAFHCTKSLYHWTRVS